MRTVAVRAAAGLLAVGLSGCSAADDGQPTVTACGRDFAVEVRDTAEGRQQGLSGRTEVPPGTGMLFRYDDAAVRGFWMSGMQVPIDLAWIDDGSIIGVVTLQPCPASETAAGTCPTSWSPGPVDTVLEVAAGQLAGVGPGCRVVMRP